MDWLFDTAKGFGDLIALIGVIATGGIWVARRVLLSIKKLENIITSQASLAVAVSNISKQLQPNGGTSIFDVVKAANAMSMKNNEAINDLRDHISRIRAYQWTFAEALTDKPIFEASEDGGFVRVNNAFSKLAERNSPELMGSGWENFVHFEDRQRVFEEWTEAVRRRRPFESGYKVQSRSGKVYRVKVTATPVFKDDGVIAAYIGRFDEVKEAA